jgi:hypothetical protein
MKPDWKAAPAWARFLAMDAGGDWYWYATAPKWNGSSWITETPDYICEATVFIAANQSLEERPNE